MLTRLISTISIMAMDMPPTISYLSVAFVVAEMENGILKALKSINVGTIYLSKEMNTFTARTAHSLPMNSLENNIEEIFILNMFKIQTISSPPIPSIKK